jgi:DNA adenine methylase
MIPKYLSNPGIPTLGYDTYIEPFFGGGAMMIWVYEHCPEVKRFVMNDVNPEIVGIYRAIKTDLSNFLTRMDVLSQQYLPLNKTDRKKFYYDLRKEYTTNWAQWNATEESATLYFLMKTGFNGIWQINQSSNGRFATPSGLLNQKTQVYDRENVKKWNAFLQQVDIYCGDWSNCVNIATGTAFYFMDPPYRDSFTQYGQVFDDHDHSKAIDFCAKADLAGHLVFFAGRDTDDDFYSSRQRNLGLSTYPITYTAGRRSTKVEKDGTKTKQAKEATEILLFSKSIQNKVSAYTNQGSTFKKLFDIQDVCLNNSPALI